MRQPKELDELFKQFFKEQTYTYKASPATLRGYIASFELFKKIMPHIVYPSDLSSTAINEFFELLEKRHRKVGNKILHKGIKKTTVATYWSKLNKFFKWLERNELIKSNPLKEMEFPRVYYDDKKYLKAEEAERVFAAINFGIKWISKFVQKRNTLLFVIALTCGLRKSELLGLKVNDVDLKRKQLSVRAETSKSKCNRVLPLNHFAFVNLEDYLEERRKRKELSEYLFISDKGGNFTEHGLKHLIEKIIRFTGRKFHIHQFRHTFAVNLIAQKCDVSKLKQLMGHKDIRMTSSYLRSMPISILRDDVERLTLDNLI